MQGYKVMELFPNSLKDSISQKRDVECPAFRLSWHQPGQRLLAMEYPRRRLVLEAQGFSSDLYGPADRRLLVKTFGAQAIDACDIVCMWNDLAPDHDWIVAVIRNVGSGDHFVCEHLASEEFAFRKVEPFSSAAYTRIANVLKNDDTPDVCHEHRLEELAAAADAANSGLGARIMHHEGNWVRSELAAMGRVEASLHGYLQPGSC
ncbi:hypothetical protein ACVIGB_001134 [Bradyrhizobium sp. USDA 4341]